MRTITTAGVGSFRLPELETVLGNDLALEASSEGFTPEFLDNERTIVIGLVETVHLPAVGTVGVGYWCDETPRGTQHIQVTDVRIVVPNHRGGYLAVTRQRLEALARQLV